MIRYTIWGGGGPRGLGDLGQVGPTWWGRSSKNQAGDRKPFCQHIHQLHQCAGDNVGRRVKKQCMGGALLTHKWRRGQVLGWGVTGVLDGCGGWPLGTWALGGWALCTWVDSIIPSSVCLPPLPPVHWCCLPWFDYYLR